MLVCEKCYKERLPDESPETARRIGDFNLRDWMKTQLKERGEWGPVRVLGTSCLDICAKDLCTVALAKNGEAARILVLDPVDERDELLQDVIETMGRATRPA